MFIRWKRGIAGYARPQTLLGTIVQYLFKRTQAATEELLLSGSIDRQLDLSGSIDRQLDISGSIARTVSLSGQLRE